MKKLKKAPRIVIFEAPKGYEDKYPWKNGSMLLYLAEVKNMKGHCVVVDEKERFTGGFTLKTSENLERMSFDNENLC